jgi:hypothetical protein
LRKIGERFIQRWLATVKEQKVSKIIARGNVMIENPDGNKTYSDSVIYLADEGRVILGGDTEALYAGGSGESFNQSSF